MLSSIINDTIKFNEFMTKLDSELASKGYSISQRPIHAVCAVANKFSIMLPITPYAPDPSHESHKNKYITDKIHGWYDHHYEDSIKHDFSPGRMAFIIEHDIWVIKFPGIWGKAIFVSSSTIKSNLNSIDGNPVLFNILDSVEGLPAGIRSTLSEDQHTRIYDDFILGFTALQSLEKHTSEEFVRLALADISSAIDNLLGSNPAYGLSKWSSLQASEKLIKTAIKSVGGKFSNTHRLNKLISEASNCGLRINANKEVMLIQCKPGIRYGEEVCSKTDAVQAQKAVFELAQKIIDLLNWNA